VKYFGDPVQFSKAAPKDLQKWWANLEELRSKGRKIANREAAIAEAEAYAKSGETGADTPSAEESAAAAKKPTAKAAAAKKPAAEKKPAARKIPAVKTPAAKQKAAAAAAAVTVTADSSSHDNAQEGGDKAEAEAEAKAEPQAEAEPEAEPEEAGAMDEDEFEDDDASSPDDDDGDSDVDPEHFEEQPEARGLKRCGADGASQPSPKKQPAKKQRVTLDNFHPTKVLAVEQLSTMAQETLQSLQDLKDVHTQHAEKASALAEAKQKVKQLQKEQTQLKSVVTKVESNLVSQLEDAGGCKFNAELAKTSGWARATKKVSKYTSEKSPRVSSVAARLQTSLVQQCTSEAAAEAPSESSGPAEPAAVPAAAALSSGQAADPSVQPSPVAVSAKPAEVDDAAKAIAEKRERARVSIKGSLSSGEDTALQGDAEDLFSAFATAIEKKVLVLPGFLPALVPL